MDVKLTSLSTGTAKSRQKMPALPVAAVTKEKTTMEQSLDEMVKFEGEQEAKARASGAVLDTNPSAKKRSVRIYRIPTGLGHISNALKIDDPLTRIRVGCLTVFIKKVDPSSGSQYWVGLTWAEIFFPVVGERPKSVLGSKAYEVILKQPSEKGGQIVRENVDTTGRIVGVVIAELPHEAVSVRVEDWFVRSDTFKEGRWKQRTR